MTTPAKRAWHKWYSKTEHGRRKRNEANRRFRAQNREKCKQGYVSWRRRYPARAIISAVKSRAKASQTEFSITEDDLQILPEFCPALGIKLNYGPGKSWDWDRPSIDRIDNKKGYIPGNVIIISWRANSLKRDAELWELKAIVDYYTRMHRRRTLNPDWEPKKPKL